MEVASFKLCACTGCNADNIFLAIILSFQAVCMYGLQRQNPTKHVAHARITMCILTFSSVLQALTFNVLQSLSRFQGGKAP